jgi:hypothetical protein
MVVRDRLGKACPGVETGFVEDDPQPRTRHCHLGDLEDQLTAEGNDLRPDLPHPLSKAGQRPLRDLAGQRERAAGSQRPLRLHLLPSDLCVSTRSGTRRA